MKTESIKAFIEKRLSKWKFQIITFWILLLIILLNFLIKKFDLYQIGIYVYIISAISIFILAIPRWHDLNKSWWYALLLIIPLVNILIFLSLFFWKWTKWNNQYWPNPLEIK